MLNTEGPRCPPCQLRGRLSDRGDGVRHHSSVASWFLKIVTDEILDSAKCGEDPWCRLFLIQ